MKRVLITGATSFIGIHLMKGLMQKDIDITAVIRPDSGKREALPKENERFHIIEADMSEYEKLGELCGVQDVVYALAWNGTRGESRADEAMQEMNLRYSMEFVKSMLAVGCRKFILAGSQAEYGVHNAAISENTAENPNTEYGKKKLEFYHKSVQLCNEYKARVIEPRFFSLYGEDDYEGTMIISVLKKMLKNEDCMLTECTQMWNFLHIDDAVEAVIRLGESTEAKGIYNLASTDTRPLKEFIIEMKKLTGSDSLLVFGRIPYPKTGAVGFTPVVDKVMYELNWEPKVSFKEGILRNIQSIW